MEKKGSERISYLRIRFLFRIHQKSCPGFCPELLKL